MLARTDVCRSTCVRSFEPTHAYLKPDIYLHREVVAASGLPFPREGDVVTFHRAPFKSKSGMNNWTVTKLLAVRSPSGAGERDTPIASPRAPNGNLPTSTRLFELLRVIILQSPEPILYSNLGTKLNGVEPCAKEALQQLGYYAGGPRRFRDFVQQTLLRYPECLGHLQMAPLGLIPCGSSYRSAPKSPSNNSARSSASSDLTEEHHPISSGTSASEVPRSPRALDGSNWVDPSCHHPKETHCPEADLGSVPQADGCSSPKLRSLLAEMGQVSHNLLAYSCAAEKQLSLSLVEVIRHSALPVLLGTLSVELRNANPEAGEILLQLGYNKQGAKRFMDFVELTLRRFPKVLGQLRILTNGPGPSYLVESATSPAGSTASYQSPGQTPADKSPPSGRRSEARSVDEPGAFDLPPSQLGPAVCVNGLASGHPPKPAVDHEPLQPPNQLMLKLLRLSSAAGVGQPPRLLPVATAGDYPHQGLAEPPGPAAAEEEPAEPAPWRTGTPGYCEPPTPTAPPLRSPGAASPPPAAPPAGSAPPPAVTALCETLRDILLAQPTFPVHGEEVLMAVEGRRPGSWAAMAGNGFPLDAEGFRRLLQQTARLCPAVADVAVEDGGGALWRFARRPVATPITAPPVSGFDASLDATSSCSSSIDVSPALAPSTAVAPLFEIISEDSHLRDAVCQLEVLYRGSLAAPTRGVGLQHMALGCTFISATVASLLVATPEVAFEFDVSRLGLEAVGAALQPFLQCPNIHKVVHDVNPNVF
eukprot:EG_transcript_4155